jgi:hypothetical protein
MNIRKIALWSAVCVSSLSAVTFGGYVIISTSIADFAAEAKKLPDPRHQARYVAQVLVYVELRSPSTATFSNVIAEDTGQNIYRVSGKVTAVNAFNSPVTQLFECSLRIIDGDVQFIGLSVERD